MKAHFNTGGSQNWQQQALVCTRPCELLSVAVANKGAVDFWLWVCDASTMGADRPVSCPIPVPAGTAQSIQHILPDVENVGRFRGRQMQHGIYVCATTDPVTKTLITAPDAFFEVAFDIPSERPAETPVIPAA